MLRRWGILIVVVALAACGGGNGSARQDALADALATDAGGDLDDEQASCVAADVLELIGEEELEELEEREAFGRAAAPFEVANVMVFLASGYSSYLTGEVISVSSQHA